jgi:hypothetical protein
MIDVVDDRVRQTTVSLFFVTVRTPQSGPDDPGSVSINITLIRIDVCTSRSRD